MASISRDAGGQRRILFVAPSGIRKTIRLGKVSQRAAESVKYRVEELLECVTLKRPMATDLAEWVRDLEPKIAKKLARVGLIEAPKAKPMAALGPSIRDYINGRADLKPATKVVRGQVIRDLVGFFGEFRDLRTITAGEADDFKQALVARKLAPTTIHKRLQVARGFFNAMRRRGLIVNNPFEGVNAAAVGMQDRQRFVKREDIDRIMDFCPDHNWRSIVALSRFGGLRCPSEVLSLRLLDIDWATNRITVTSPKTAHHPGGGSRVIPLFAELLPYLREAAELAPVGAVYVVDERFRKAAMGPGGWANANLRTTFTKIIRKAGLSPWPRLFHNLRASRETELVELHPVQAVTGWLGNTPRIALKHYLMTRPEHFDKAVNGPVDAPKKAAQNPAQSVAVLARNDQKRDLPAHEKTLGFPGFAGSRELLRKPGMAGTGFEPATSRL